MAAAMPICKAAHELSLDGTARALMEAYAEDRIVVLAQGGFMA